MTFPMQARPREGVTITRFQIMLALSIALHAAVFWKVTPQLHHMTFDEPEQGANSGSLAVRLAPPAQQAAPAEAQVEPAPPPKAAKRTPPPPPPPQRPPVLAMSKPQPSAAQPAPVPAPPPVETAPPPPRPSADDFAAAVEARRRAREGSAPQAPSSGMIASAPAETEAERARRITAANLAPKQIVFGYDPAAGGGVFQIRTMSDGYAQVAFFGWSKEIRRKTLQLIDINKGNNSDIRLAVVRRMIAIIREYEKDDFSWESRGRTVILSARLRDNAGLEEYMLREFFPDQTVVR